MPLPKTTIVILLLLFISCKTQNKSSNLPENLPKTVTADFDGEQLLKHVKELASDAYEGRETGTPGATKAKNYIISEFKKLGVEPLGKTFVQEFPLPEKFNASQGENILGYIKGSLKANEYIVITAHYDHEGIQDGNIYNGADDDASGISGLFAFAEYFKRNPPKHSVILAAFDAEEKGLLGSYYFVDNSMVPKAQLKLNINMDMISRSDKKELFAVGPQYTEKLKPIIENVERSGDVKLIIGHKEWTFSSDHAGFHSAGIPFVYFGVEDHEDYHKPTDDFENIQPTFYKNAMQTIISFFKIIDTKEL
ncbi:M28 family peptidase [Kordia sp. YSTF-M3]|uniref:M28 family peptidase n=1 Tax=Kordia aestuariivivens TaxID=2759037 RepID=A0ABR7Q7B2_9FLAO|nr:M28 family peptidase [Kordia aestuariivivens]MBC8754440.1 M28 family peptidase [Kordia aestuariivivens]